MQRRAFRVLDWLPIAVRLCATELRKRPGVTVGQNLCTGACVTTGTYHCRSAVSCAPCRETMMARWRRRLVRLIEALRERGGTVLLVTFTVAHGAGDDVRKVRTLVSRSLNGLTRGRAWDEWAKSIGYLGLARVIEVTHSEYAGFHPHLHCAFFLSGKIDENQRAAIRLHLTARWIELVARESDKLGIDVGLPSVDRAVTVQHCSTAGEYVTKMGIAAEMTDPGRKVGHVDHRTMPEVASALAVSLRHGFKARSQYDERILRRYIEAMRRARIFHVGRNLAKKIDALPLAHDTPAELVVSATAGDEIPDPVAVVYTFVPGAYDDFVRFGGPMAEADLESLVEDGGTRSDVARFVADVMGGYWTAPTDPLYRPDRRFTIEAHGPPYWPGV